MTGPTGATGDDPQMSAGNETLRLDELPHERIVIAVRDGIEFAVTRVGDEVYAVANKCTHAGSSFAQGRVAGCQLTCPMHGARFDLRNGACLNSPYRPLTVHAVRIADGEVQIGPALPAA